MNVQAGESPMSTWLRRKRLAAAAFASTMSVKMYGAGDAGVLAVDHCTFDVPPGEITVCRRPLRLRQDNAAQCHCRLS